MKKYLAIGMMILAVGCGDDGESNNAASNNANNVNNANNSNNANNTNNDNNTNNEGPALSDSVCNYSNPFSRAPECRGYEAAFTAEQIQADCDTQQGEVSQGACATEGFIGNCTIPVEGVGNTILFAYGDAGSCGAQKVGCETFAKGTWEPAGECVDGGGNNSSSGGNVFLPPQKICMDPVNGEPAGNGPNGQVCTWESISGATEAGRKFVDYASCENVLTQRPYYPLGRPADAEKEDARLDDPTYAAELAWVKSEIEATACVCCHQGSITPDGASNWDIEQPGNFMNGFFDKGLALGPNWVDSVALGAYEASENNGFEREISGFPTTDPQRMTAFFIAELEHRGLTQDDFADTPPFGGPLYDQIFFEPDACPDSVGIAEDGTITWEGGAARYIVILEAGSLNPTVPPNLDKPEGTLWKLDVSPVEDALSSGAIKYGEVPDTASQSVPVDVPAPTLSAGTDYFLHVSADVGFPLTRCLTRF